MSLRESLIAVRQRIEHAGRNPDEITIVAVTKGFGPEVCRQAVSAGLTNLGENRVVEALEKMPSVDGAEWHLIGHLQTNKVRLASRQFALIQTVDSQHLAETIARVNPGQKVLVEVNVAREPQRTGVDPDRTGPLIDEVSRLLDLRGLMAMGPGAGDPGPVFDELRALRDSAQERLGKALPILSMGMSGDFEPAVRSGSTMLRLGTILLGPRP